LSDGEVITEASVLTQIGVRVPDAAWASHQFLSVQRYATPFTAAPEICVEIVSPSNTNREIEAKVQAYLAGGAKEVWVVTEEPSLRIFDGAGLRERSAFQVTVELPVRPNAR
jgi:Uma2 family endonuclease